MISALGVPQDSAACKLIREAQEIDQRIGVSGVISADRVFGLLEREFLSRDIESSGSFRAKTDRQLRFERPQYSPRSSHDTRRDRSAGDD